MKGTSAAASRDGELSVKQESAAESSLKGSWSSNLLGVAAFDLENCIR